MASYPAFSINGGVRENPQRSQGSLEPFPIQIGLGGTVSSGQYKKPSKSTLTHTHIHTHDDTHADTYIHRHTHADSLTYTHMHIHTFINMQTHSHSDIHIITQRNIRTHTNTHTHALTISSSCWPPSPLHGGVELGPRERLGSALERPAGLGSCRASI